jgi:hypothetical protein
MARTWLCTVCMAVWSSEEGSISWRMWGAFCWRTERKWFSRADCSAFEDVGLVFWVFHLSFSLVVVIVGIGTLETG